LRRGSAAPPARVEADTSDAKFLEESDVFREVSVVHEREQAYHTKAQLAATQSQARFN
jgi:hypothetical protein